MLVTSRWGKKSWGEEFSQALWKYGMAFVITLIAKKMLISSVPFPCYKLLKNFFPAPDSRDWRLLQFFFFFKIKWGKTERFFLNGIG